MRNVNLNSTGLTIAIILSALVVGFLLALVTVRASTPQASADVARSTSVLVLSNTLDSLEINVTPTIASSPASESHTITATVATIGDVPAGGVEVSFRIIAGPHEGVSGSDITDGNGIATFTHTGEKAGTDTIASCFTDDSGNRACDLAAKLWTRPASPPVIRLTPFRDTNPVGSEHTVTAAVRARGEANEPLAGVLVGFRVTTGPTAGVTGSDTTDAQGEATFSYRGVAEGVDVITACVDGEASGRACDRALKRWTDPDDSPGGDTSCQGEDSCRGRNLSVGENSCNGENSCRGNSLTIGDDSCNEPDSCRGNNQAIGDDSCNGQEACRGNRSRIGSESCNGQEACNGDNNSVGHNSCNGAESCVGHNGDVGDNECNSDGACPGTGNGGNNDDRGDGDDDDEGDEDDDGDDNRQDRDSDDDDD